MFLAFGNKLRQENLPIFFIENIEFGVILIFVTLDVVIQIFYRFVLALVSREGIPTGLSPDHRRCHWSPGAGGDTIPGSDVGHRLFIFAR